MIDAFHAAATNVVNNGNPFEHVQQMVQAPFDAIKQAFQQHAQFQLPAINLSSSR